MTRVQAWVKAAGIFIYVVLAIVLIPDFIIGLDAMSSASTFVRDGVVLAVWGAGFVGGLWMLRRLQANGHI